MKRFLTVFTLVLTLCAALCVTAAAADYDAVAQELSTIGMFRGTGDSFELDRAPTRGEAAIMLVRLYGAEAQAQADYAAGTIAHPFTDVPDWTAPHVAWLYTNGLTKGMSEATFGAAEVCTDQNYATFLLRALGWQDGVDFAYADALAFAQMQGFYDPAVFTGPFLRDDLAALTYQALATDTADGESWLLARLVADGAIDPAAAAPMTEKMEVWRALLAAYETALPDEGLDATMEVLCDVAYTHEGAVTTQSSEVTAQYTVSGEDAAVLTTATVDGVSVGTNVWVKDGWNYMSMDMGGLYLLRVKYPAEEEPAVDAPIDTEEEQNELGLAMVHSITVEEIDGKTVYTIVQNPSMGHLMEDARTAVQDNLPEGSVVSNLQYSSIIQRYTVDKDGTVCGEYMDLMATADVVYPDESGSMVRVSILMEYQVDLTVHAWGKDVEIHFPDFSAFQEIDPALLED